MLLLAVPASLFALGVLLFLGGRLDGLGGGTTEGQIGQSAEGLAFELPGADDGPLQAGRDQGV